MNYDINSSPASFDKLFREEPHRWNAEVDPADVAIKLFLIDYVRDKTDLKLIDLGCAPGRTLECLSSLGMFLEKLYMVGVDFSPVGLKMAKENNPGIDFIECDMTATPFEDKSFDVVLAVGSYEHLRSRTFAEPRRLVKDGGVFLCVLPFRIETLGWAEWHRLWEWDLTQKDWEEEIRNYGFRVERCSVHRFLLVCYPIKEVKDV